jgi:hypothetical protein
MLAGMLVPASLCVAIGIVPKAVVALIEPVNRLTVGEALFAGGGRAGFVFLAPASAFGNSYSGLLMVAVITLLSTVLVLGIHRYASNRVRRSIPWGCGFPDPGPTSQYTASSFGQPIRRVFVSGLFLARESVDMPRPGETRPARFTLRLSDPAWDLLFTPLGRSVDWITARANRLQFLTIRQYLSMMFAALVVLLVMVAVSQRPAHRKPWPESCTRSCRWCWCWPWRPA